MATDADTKWRTWRYWARIGATTVAASIVVMLGFSGVTWRTPWRQVGEALGIALLFSSIIAPMLAVVMPRVARAVASRFRFPFDWLVLVAIMVGLATGGSFAAILILAAIGYLQGAGIVATWMAGSLKVSILITLTFGIFTTVLESMRSRLNDATVALRTKERDEADAQRLAAEAQLASIESRVQPHFLFNTLNSIAALVHDDPAGAERMTAQLASLLRSALDSTATPLITLEAELRVVRAYLDIERVRFGERLRYTVDVADGTARTPVPSARMRKTCALSFSPGCMAKVIQRPFGENFQSRPPWTPGTGQPLNTTPGKWFYRAKFVPDHPGLKKPARMRGNTSLEGDVYVAEHVVACRNDIDLSMEPKGNGPIFVHRRPALPALGIIDSSVDLVADKS